MFRVMLAQVICQTFEKEVGKWQDNKPEADRQGMHLTFRMPTNYDHEEGYRHVELFIFGPKNYVQVWFRDTWDVIALSDMVDAGSNEGEMVPKKGKHYTKGASEWTCIGDHDSCWRDSVEGFFRTRPQIAGWGGPLGDFFKKMTPPANLAELKEKQRGRG